MDRRVENVTRDRERTQQRVLAVRAAGRSGGRRRERDEYDSGAAA